MTERFENMAQSALAASVDGVTDPVEITVVSANAFPFFPNWRILIDSEIFLVTSARYGDFNEKFMASRAQEDTAIDSHAAPAQATHVLTRESLKNIIDERSINVGDSVTTFLADQHWFITPAAADPTALEAGLLITSNDYTWIPSGPSQQPDVPRTLIITPDTNTPGVVTVIGTGSLFGVDISSFVLGSGFTTQTALESLQAIHFGGMNGRTVDIGITDQLGLPQARRGSSGYDYANGLPHTLLAPTFGVPVVTNGLLSFTDANVPNDQFMLVSFSDPPNGLRSYGVGWTEVRIRAIGTPN